jgi:hypothetical protein
MAAQNQRCDQHSQSVDDPALQKAQKFSRSRLHVRAQKAFLHNASPVREKQGTF